MLCFRHVTTARRLIPLGSAALIAAALAPAAVAGPVSTLPTTKAPRLATLAPGITHERVVRPGGQVVHVVRGRPGPRVSLAPALAGGSPTARGRLTAAVAARQDLTGAVAGVNGDFFNYATGNPSGLLMIDRQIISEPEASRSALIIRSDGLLDSAVVGLQGRWQASDPAGELRFGTRTFQGINRSPQRAAEAILYTTGYGAPRTPAGASLWEARIRLDADVPPQPGVPLTGTVIGTAAGGGSTIGRGHVVLTGVGSSGRNMARDLAPGRRITITPGLVSLSDLQPLAAEAVSAVGGGPRLVRDGTAVYDHGEGLTGAQLNGRTARTAVGQHHDGTLLLVTAEGPAQGSPGITAREQADLMVTLGARVAVAMDAGGSAQMALGTQPAVAWGAAPRSLANVVLLSYRGLRLEPLPPRISPNADRVDDSVVATVRTPVGGRVTVDVTHRSGRPTRHLWRGDLGGSSARVRIDPRKLRLKDGIYLVRARLTPVDGGPQMVQQQRLIVDRTLGSLTARPSGRGARARLAVGFRLTRGARVTVQVRHVASGRVVARLSRGRAMAAGRHTLVWNRRVKKAQASGRHAVEVIASGAFGRSGLVRTVTLAAPARP